MLKFGNTVVVADLGDIIRALRAYIQNTPNAGYLKQIKSSSDSIMVSCPFHKGGTEQRPSCGILRQDKGGVPAGTFHCFTCHERGSLLKFINKVLGEREISSVALRWLQARFDLAELYNRNLKLDFGLEKATKIITDYVSEEELKKYRVVHKYMYKRKLTDEIIEKFDVGYDGETQCITFPVRDLSGRTLFIARRSVKTKFFNYPKNVEKSLYGIYELGSKQYKDVWICESIINALTLWSYGIPAVATNGVAFSKKQLAQLLKINTNGFIIAFDGDIAGDDGAKKLGELLRGRRLVSIAQLPRGKDINDLSIAEVKALEVNWT